MYYEDENYYEPSVMNELLDEFQQKCREILLDDTISNLITFSWFGEKEDPYIHEETCYTCPNCKKPPMLPASTPIFKP